MVMDKTSTFLGLGWGTNLLYLCYAQLKKGWLQVSLQSSLLMTSKFFIFSAGICLHITGSIFNMFISGAFSSAYSVHLQHKTHSLLVINMFICSVISYLEVTSSIPRWLAETISSLALNKYVCHVILYLRGWGATTILLLAINTFVFSVIYM